MANLVALLYLISGVLFILSLRGLSHPETSRRGNLFGMVGMGLAIFATVLLSPPTSFFSVIMIIIAVCLGGGIGIYIARHIAMTAMPQLVAAFHSLVGLSAVFVAFAAFYSPSSFGIGVFGEVGFLRLFEMSLGLLIGAITFTGSVVAFLKLQGLVSGSPVSFYGQHWLNLLLGIILFCLILAFCFGSVAEIFWLIAILSFILGILLIIPIGGADMPVVISMLNSYSGWAAAGIGFTIENSALIITGALVGASGAILSYIMCRGMNRSFVSVILGGFGADSDLSLGSVSVSDRPVKQGGAEDASFALKNARRVVIIPGYGMAVAQAQHVLREMVDFLKDYEIDVRYAIHPVAGRMPGHMNVLLAEANVPYDEIYELEDINSDFGSTDISFVIGANDITNPSAKDDKHSPIYGMPVLEVWKSGTVMFLKRSLSSGYAGIDNPLFYRDNTMMLFGDARKMVEGIIKSF